MINLADNEVLLRCDSADHIAFLKHDDADEWYLTVLLDPITPWWRRLWRALRPHDRFAEIVLKDEDARRIAEFIRGRLKAA